ncbi:hypothetical protein [Pleomorphomonas sp. NRK KF1]|uniref:hypothetical protein n=1 Tax=Pleomorphomonas sp. NRK KF1 TaxID=2943000 RepID=UPI002043875F|nr:hypothetical protein [Pleomorphomonas sp. NRK KF1]MCM5553023.1 hypothetical protein [Pleomorphomonas sp. NRK KF1]
MAFTTLVAAEPADGISTLVAAWGDAKALPGGADAPVAEEAGPAVGALVLEPVDTPGETPA